MEKSLRYEDVFSRHHLDCGEAKGFVNRIRLVDDRPFRLPYRCVPPAEYQKLRQVLNEMEEKEIIRKSASEFASPLVLVWKKNSDLRVCTDFRWFNKRTVKDAHPLPHQADCLAVLGGNAFFSTMDLTSGFYNMPLHEEDHKYSTFTTPMGLYEYNRLPQGLCNSPASFIRMMTSIFGDQNFLSLLCYLDNLLVFAPTEALALERLELVFSRLRLHNLKLAPKECWLLRKSVKFLGHVIDESGVSTDPAKVETVNKITAADLMEPDKEAETEKQTMHKAPCSLQEVASLAGLGAVLTQIQEGDSVARPVAFARKRSQPSLRHTVYGSPVPECELSMPSSNSRNWFHLTTCVVLKGIHDNAGHQGQFRSLSLARQRFFWPHIDQDVKEYVRRCPRCIIKTSNNKSVDVLVVTDHFTRLAQAFPCREQSAKQRIYSDQDASFESQLICELLKVAGVRKSRTTPYHPMGNGSVERFNRKLGNMIRALSPEAKLNWPRHLQTLTFMYNPFFLMYGRVPRLPVDILFKNVLRDPEISSYNRYVVSLTKDLQEAMAIAQRHVNKEQNCQAELYNRREKGKQIAVGES
ncbi:hypothetical protein ACEWY4_013985 [Coilia grayii]|uniref:Gypsy retrotransposon integrase-like protein 1 n=1 Tax=Coilia grayii TaxID=363190 RepID=A0ABD1JR06_9TELE